MLGRTISALWAIEKLFPPGAGRVARMGGAWSELWQVITKKQTLFGSKLHLLITLNGIILDFILAPAYETDVMVGEELLREPRERIVLGDQGYMSAGLARTLATENRVTLPTIPRRLVSTTSGEDQPNRCFRSLPDAGLVFERKCLACFVLQLSISPATASPEALGSWDQVLKL